jgi:hypothetical protein
METKSSVAIKRFPENLEAIRFNESTDAQSKPGPAAPVE